MRILMVAPQPFFRPRGTPFSVLHRIRALVRLGHLVDLVTYPLGESPVLEGLRILRSSALPGVRDVPVGPSLAKLALDGPLFMRASRLARNPAHVRYAFEPPAAVRELRPIQLESGGGSLPAARALHPGRGRRRHRHLRGAPRSGSGVGLSRSGGAHGLRSDAFVPEIGRA